MNYRGSWLYFSPLPAFYQIPRVYYRGFLLQQQLYKQVLIFLSIVPMVDRIHPKVFDSKNAKKSSSSDEDFFFHLQYLILMPNSFDNPDQDHCSE
mgnify:CR=1 FL=1